VNDEPLDGCPPHLGCVSRRVLGGETRIAVHSYACDDAMFAAFVDETRPAARARPLPPRYCPKCGEPDPQSTDEAMWCTRCSWTAERASTPALKETPCEP
jgi:hypothetical protein